jgi:predicted nucleotidyltransferase
MATARQLLQEKRDEILRLAALHGAGQVRVFGSVARGDDSPDSDIDLLVHMDDGRSLMDLVRLKMGIEALMHLSVDVVDEGSLSRYIRDRVLAEARPL